MVILSVWGPTTARNTTSGTQRVSQNDRPVERPAVFKAGTAAKRKHLAPNTQHPATWHSGTQRVSKNRRPVECPALFKAGTAAKRDDLAPNTQHPATWHSGTQRVRTNERPVECPALFKARIKPMRCKQRVLA